MMSNRLKKIKKTTHLAGFDMTAEYAPEMPKTIPKLTAIMKANSAYHTQEGVILSIKDSMAALTYDLYFEYANGKAYPPSGITAVAADSGFGKSATTEANEALALPLAEADLDAEQVRDNYNKACKRCKPNERKPEEPADEDIALRMMQPNQSRPNVVLASKQAEKARTRMYMNIKEFTAIKIQGEGEQGRTEFLLAAGEDGTFGAGRATPDGVSGKSPLRLNINFSLTIKNAPFSFTRKHWRDGVIGRIYWVCMKPKPGYVSQGIPVEKEWNTDEFKAKIKPYQDNLQNTKGRLKCKQLNDTANELAVELDELVALTDNDALKELTNRLIRQVWIFSMLLWVSEGCKYHKYLSDWMIYAVKYGLWSVVQIFGEYFIPKTKRRTEDEVRKYMPTNLLSFVPNPFTWQDMSKVRAERGKSENWQDYKRQLKTRNHIRQDEKDGKLFWKTEVYFEAHPEDPTNPSNNQG